MIENEIQNEVGPLDLHGNLCLQCGIREMVSNELCRRCTFFRHLKKRFKQTGKTFWKTFIFAFISLFILSFQGRFGIHVEWFPQSLFLALITALLASLVAIAWKGFHNNQVS